MLQNSQENTCTGVSFLNKVAGFQPATIKKRNSGAGVSCELCDTVRTTILQNSFLILPQGIKQEVGETRLWKNLVAVNRSYASL